jgi:hypothetical protein
MMRLFQSLTSVTSSALAALFLVTACKTAENGGPAQPLLAEADRIQRDIGLVGRRSA